MQYTLGDLDSIYTEQQDSSLLLNLDPQQILEQAMTESNEELDNASYQPPEPQPSVSKVVMPMDEDSKDSTISEPQGLLIDNDVDIDIDIDIGIELDTDLTFPLDLNVAPPQPPDPDLEYDSD